MHIGFIGTGAMASAIIQGIVASGAVSAKNIHLTCKHGRSASQLADTTGATPYASNLSMLHALPENSLVVIAVKPTQIPTLLPELANVLHQKNHTVLSIAAGVTLATLNSLLFNNHPIIRVMPNVNVKVREGMSAICANSQVDRRILDYVLQVFQTVGDVVEIPESLFAVFSAIAGASPAWTAKYIDSLATGALALGLPKATAVRIAAQAVLGTARNLLSSTSDNLTPMDLMDLVQSPGGTTVAGSLALEANGFAHATINAVQASVKRDQELSRS